MIFIHKVPLAPSKCLSKWIKMDKWDYFQNGSRDFFLFYILIFIHFLKYETIVRSSAWAFCHSDPYPSSVILYPLIISIKIDELSNSTLGVKTWTYFDKFICLVFFINMPFKSRVKSRVHTRDLKGLLIKKNTRQMCWL